MKIRNRTGETKIETQMAPMIDVVFQLLIFFMLTLKIIEPEGDFSINMPLGKADPNSPADPDLAPMRVRMEANPANGALQQLYFRDQALGDNADAFVRLNMEILKAKESLEAIGADKVANQEIEIDFDYGLRYEFVISAIGACSGRVVDGRQVQYFQRIKFAPIRPEQ